MRKRGTSCRPVSVRPGTLVYWIQTAKDIVKHITRLTNAIILSFCAQVPLRNCKENPQRGR